MRPDLAREAIRLARLLDALMPGRGEIKGLLALMLLHDSRRAGRETAGGDIVLLEEQDRTLWDREQIAEGLRLVEAALRVPGRPQSYAVQAAIAALHVGQPPPVAVAVVRRRDDVRGDRGIGSESLHFGVGPGDGEGALTLRINTSRCERT